MNSTTVRFQCSDSVPDTAADTAAESATDTAADPATATATGSETAVPRQVTAVPLRLCVEFPFCRRTLELGSVYPAGGEGCLGV